MIPPSFHAPGVQRFIIAVRRRILLVRVAESVALATAVASGAGLILIPLLWWRGQSGVDPALAILALGAACGIVWGISRRPTPLEAAVEADRQLGLHDLLATVLLLQRTKSDLTTPQWRQTLAAMAESRCATLRPSAIVVARLNLRAWGGIGIAAALLLTVGVLSSRPLDLRASTPDGELTATTPPPPEPLVSATSANPHATETPRPVGSGNPQEDSSRNFTDDRPVDSPATSTTAAMNSAPSIPGDTANRGVGTGLAVTHTTLPPTNLTSSSSEQSPASNVGEPGAGSGPSDSRPKGSSSGGAASSSGTVANSHSNRASQLPAIDRRADAHAAEQAIQNGRVPDSDADLVRDYFQSE